MESAFPSAPPKLGFSKLAFDASSIVSQLAPTGLFNTKQAATYLGIEAGTLTVWRSTNRRVLPYVKIGSQVRYRKEDLDKFISANLHNA
jgi:excisionase family DNA binding protein